jgi:hypothetical protein
MQCGRVCVVFHGGEVEGEVEVCGEVMVVGRCGVKDLIESFWLIRWFMHSEGVLEYRLMVTMIDTIMMITVVLLHSFCAKFSGILRPTGTR